MKKLLKNTSGATAVEYGLMAALIAIAIITALQTLGTNVGGNFNKVATTMGTGS